jgi:DNA-binding SARP family transcriptional activator
MREELQVTMPAKLRLNLLGIPEVYLDEQPIPFKTRKSHALLFYLVCNPGPQPRDVVAELLWPDMPTRQSLKNLRDGLTQLRAAVGDYITASIQWVEFNRQLPYEFDVELFSSGVSQAQATLDLAKLQGALNLYRGDFLLGFHVQNAQPFDEWVLQQREELYIQAVSGLEWLAEQYCHQHEYNIALTVNRRLLKLEPWRESAHRLQMQLLAFSGHNSDALAHYKICQRVLLEELDVQPTAETVALY